MHSHPTSPQPQGAARALERYPLVRRPAVFRLQVGATDLVLSPSVLSRHDNWQLNEHRRRCEELGAPRAVRLARLIRAKLLGAWVTETADLPPDVVAGDIAGNVRPGPQATRDPPTLSLGLSRRPEKSAARPKLSGNCTDWHDGGSMPALSGR